MKVYFKNFALFFSNTFFWMKVVISEGMLHITASQTHTHTFTPI